MPADWEGGVWLIAGSLTTDPYPCRCDERLYSKCSPKYCPCAGRRDLWNLPIGCCGRIYLPRSGT